METDSRLTLVIVGNGMVSYKFCERLVENGATAQFHVVVFGEERVPAYDRVHLTEFFGSDDTEDLLLAPETWYTENGIELHLGTSVESIDREQRIIHTSSDLYIEYDKLVFATGSYPFVPSIDGTNLPGVFVYRTIDDLRDIEDYSRNAKSVAAIGGGLLGLEVTRALEISREEGGIEAHIVHRSSHLMSRQLNPDAAAVLQNKVEEMDIRVHLNKQTTHITAEGKTRVLHFTDGSLLPVEMVVISAGVRPRDELARACNLICSVDGGIEINDELQTSDTDIYAIGECASHKGKFYGLVSPGYKMAEVLAKNLTAVEKQNEKRLQRFEGGDVSTTLKLMGVDVAVFGEYRSEDAHITFANSDVYRQLAYRNGKCVGATVVGIWREMGKVQQAVAANRRIWFWNSWRFRRKGKLWREQSMQGVQNWSEDTVICNCTGVKRGELSHACTTGCRTVAALSETTGAATVCGMCVPLLEELIIGMPTVSERYEDNPPLQYSWRGLFGASLVGLFLVLLTYFSRPIPFSATAQNLHHVIDALWRDNFWKQVTGYTLLGLSAGALILSLRKRWKWLPFGDFGIWRLIHALIGIGTLVFLVAHTGFRLGNNLNQILMMSFLMLNLVGTLGGGITALSAKRGSTPLHRWQNWLIRVHTVLFWPLPVLILFHIIAIYYF
ncbi:NAD(P)/FAD-dependent oxidoreductase [Candidatus Poribacteria bacterium]|nr:FAD-dependent oxidoreductase [Candidatus Poribacteria bacterium]MXY29041.1 NAD(P)/FAD-dependent oxidoreductase [Candidatus Poribacteria bacterium]MYK17436.1 NAD(P)/FAD-dependent oxidoreductase [Candidatus Poribacteria bacterium]